MISDNQASESCKSTLFRMNPEKGHRIFVALGLATNICRGSIYSWSVLGRLLQKLWSIDATDLIAIYLASSVFRPFDTFSGGALDLCGPLQIQRVRVMKINSGE